MKPTYIIPKQIVIVLDTQTTVLGTSEQPQSIKINNETTETNEGSRQIKPVTTFSEDMWEEW